jgi:large-conductance mechanosensitive channel
LVNKGNIVDLAVAVVTAGGFGKVGDAFVSLVMGNVLEPASRPPTWIHLPPGPLAA